MQSTSVENYLKTIFMLETEHERASTRRIAEQLGVRMASVTGMIKHLAAKGYVRYKPYQGATLTDEGRRLAVAMIRRHRLIELFLMKTLGLTWDQVHEEAEELEHALSDFVVERIDEYLGRPQFDPHGSVIPAADGTIAPRGDTTLAGVGEGQPVRVDEVPDGDPDFLRFLDSLGLRIGTITHVENREPFGGAIALRVGDETVSIGPEAARRIRVSRVRRADAE